MFTGNIIYLHIIELLRITVDKQISGFIFDSYLYIEIILILIKGIVTHYPKIINAYVINIVIQW